MHAQYVYTLIGNKLNNMTHNITANVHACVAI